MEAILITPGPVSTPKGMKSTKSTLRSISTHQFVEAASQLQAANFGMLKSVLVRNGMFQYVFLKKEPAEVEQAFYKTPGLCSLHTYTKRFARSPPKAISSQLQAWLVGMKLVSPDQFKS